MRPTMETINIWVALNLAQRTIYRKIEAKLKAEGLPPLNWYDVLWSLNFKGNGLRPIEIEKYLLFEQSNLSRLLRKMIDAGVIEERPYEKDRRGKLLHLTESGKKLHDQYWDSYGQEIQQLVGEIPANFDAPQLTEALNSLVEKEKINQYR